MLWNKWQSIKTKILVSFIALLMIPMSLIAVFNYWKSASILEDKARQQFLYLSEVTNQQFDQYITNLDTLSMNVVESPVIQSRLMQPYIPAVQWTPKQIADEEEVKDFLSGIHKLTPGISGIGVYGFNGIYDVHHSSLHLGLDFNPQNEDWYLEAARRNGGWILGGKRIESEFSFFKSISDEAVVTFSRQILNLDSLKPMGVLAINVKISELESIWGITETGRHLVIIDEYGQTIVATNEAESNLQDSGWLQSSSISPITGWTSIHLISKQELFKESKDIRSFIILLTFLLSVGAVIFAHLLSSSIVKPLQVLKSKMREIEKGNFQGELLVIHRDEVGELTQRFNRMMVRMKNLMAENSYRVQQKAQLEMDALQARINPHFLYNTLMALRIQAVLDGNIKLGELIASLVHLLKFSAKNKQKLIKLKNELELLDQYVKLLQLRNENFDFQLEMDSGMEDHLVFPFLLQPIVENAIFHGVGPLQRRGRIKVTIHRMEDYNLASVQDDGVGMDSVACGKLLHPGGVADGNEHLHKIGVSNVYERLKLQFNELAEMSVNSMLGVGTTVTVKWPVQLEGDE